MTYAEIEARAAADQLTLLGGIACNDDACLPKGTRTLILLGPKETGYWAHVQTQQEWAELLATGAPDPVDRWSRRVIGRLACDLGAKALFPFGGPPWHPFHQWALRTGRVHDSPVRLLVHVAQGLMVSFRGALALKQTLDLPAPGPSPCDTCVGKPCLSVCPPRALTGQGYELPACHRFLDTAAGSDCMTAGCLVRRACPVSQGYDRMPEQSAYHMQQFHKGNPTQ